MQGSHYQRFLWYFRWYSVIFQLVLVNLQETIVPCMNIPLLNCNNSKYGDWFIDRITPRGISFDGMMPHACKFSLGRQKFTPDKPWKTELIKPVSEMLTYLNSEENLKNGYHLGDILTKTCHVYGDRSVSEEFKRGVAEVLDKQDGEVMETQIKKQIVDDLYKFATKSTLMQMKLKKYIDIKKDIYRSTTIFISALGRIFRVRTSSCFEIIAALAEQQEISEDAKHKLMYAISLACELRLRWYQLKESQDDKMENQVLPEEDDNMLVNIWGKSSTVSYFRIAYSLQSDISHRLGLTKLLFYFNPQFINISISYFLGDLNTTDDLLNKYDMPVFSDSMLSFDKCQALLDNDELSLITSTSSDHGLDAVLFPAKKINHDFEKVGDILRSLNCYDDVLHYLTQSFTESQSIDNANEVDIIDKDSQLKGPINLQSMSFEKARYLAINYRRMAVCLMSLTRNEEALVLLKEALEVEKCFVRKYGFNLNIMCMLTQIKFCLQRMGRLEEAHSYKLQLVEELAPVLQESISEKQLIDFAQEYGKLLLDVNNINVKLLDAKYLQLFSSFFIDYNVKTLDTAVAPDLNQWLQNYHYTDGLLRTDFQVKINLSNFDEKNVIAKISLSDVNDDTENSSENEVVLTCNARLLVKNGEMYSNAKTKEDVIDCFRKLSQQKIISEIDAGSQEIASMDLSEATNRSNFTEREIEMLSNLITVENWKNLAITASIVAQTYMEVNHFGAALKFLEKSLLIFEVYSIDRDRDLIVASILFEVGFCLHALGRFSDAITIYKRSLEIKERCLLVFETDGIVAATLLNIGVCYFHQNEGNYPTDFFEKALEIRERMPISVRITRRKMFLNTASFIGILDNDVDVLPKMKDDTVAMRSVIEIDVMVGAHFYIAQSLLRVNNTEDAIKYFDKAKQALDQTTESADTDASTMTKIINSSIDYSSSQRNVLTQ